MLQLRKVGRTIEMLGEPSVQRISVGSEVEEWWAEELARKRAQAVQTGRGDVDGREGGAGEGNVTQRGDGVREGDQWRATLPGHGGT